MVRKPMQPECINFSLEYSKRGNSSDVLNCLCNYHFGKNRLSEDKMSGKKSAFIVINRNEEKETQENANVNDGFCCSILSSSFV